VKRIYFTGSRKTDKNYWSSPVLEPDSIRKHVLMGLEQGKDTVMPDVQFRAFFKPFVEDELPEISRDTLKLLAHPADSPGPQIKNDTAITLAVGPEGGYTDYEAGLFKEKGFDIVSLGERVLRVEFAVTALIARLAFFKY
jgi:RsmE family RNA methyltransferase